MRNKIRDKISVLLGDVVKTKNQRKENRNSVSTNNYR